MAQTETKPRKNRNRPPQNQNDSTTAVMDPPDLHSGLPPGEPPAAQPARKPAPKEQKTAKSITFFQRVDGIPANDWGARASIRLYRLEPLIDQLRGSSNKYITVYAEPVSEEKIKQDFGSGRYRLYLNYKEAGAHEGKELDSVEIDILDMRYPPKIPPGAWIDNPINKNWQWAKDAAPAPVVPPTATQAAGGTLETLKVLNEIRRDARDEFRPEPAAKQDSMLDIIKGVKEIFPTPAPATDNGLLNTVVTLLTTQIQSQQAETAELRKELRERQNGNGGGFSVEKLVEGADKVMPLIERIWPAAKDAAEKTIGRAVRSNMNGWQEFLQPALPAIINSPIWGAIAQGMMMKAASQQAPTQNGAPHPNPSHALPQGPQPVTSAPGDNRGPLVQFLDEIVRPMMNHLQIEGDGAEIGGEFAAWLYDGYSSDPRYDQAISTARMMGIPTLIGLYKQSPYWTQLGAHEAKFTAFLEAMLKWEPPADEPGDDGVIDLTAEAHA